MKIERKHLWTLLLMGVLIVLIFGSVRLLRGEHEEGAVTVNETAITVFVADTAFERARGLSGVERAELGESGVLFVFPDKAVRNFWMKDMQFALDVVWIADDKIVSIDKNIQPPAAGEEPARMSSNPIPVNYVLELPAGGAAKYGLVPGLPVTIEFTQ